MSTRERDVARRELIIPGMGTYSIPVERYSDLRTLVNTAVSTKSDYNLKLATAFAMWYDNAKVLVDEYGEETYDAGDLPPISDRSIPAYFAVIDSMKGPTEQGRPVVDYEPPQEVKEQERPKLPRQKTPTAFHKKGRVHKEGYIYGKWFDKGETVTDEERETLRQAWLAGETPEAPEAPPTPTEDVVLGERGAPPSPSVLPQFVPQVAEVIPAEPTQTQIQETPTPTRPLTTGPKPQEAPEGPVSFGEVFNRVRASSLFRTPVAAPGLQRVSFEPGAGFGERFEAHRQGAVAVQAQEPAVTRPGGSEGFREGLVEGIESGIERYLQIFGVEPEDEQLLWSSFVPVRERAHTARVIGELAGATIPFAAGFGATSLGLSALGLGSRMTPLALNMTKSALTGASLGALATPLEDASFGEVAKNMAKEAALWTAFDAGALALTGKLGSMIKQTRDIKKIRSQLLGGDEYINPLILKVEDAIHPNMAKDYRAVANRVYTLWKVDPDKPLAGAVAEIAGRTEALGVSIVEGLPEKAVQDIADDVIRALPDGYKSAVYKNGANSKLLVADVEGAMGMGTTSQRLETIWHTWQSGGEVNPRNLITLLRKGAADQSGIAPLEIVPLALPKGARTTGKYEFSPGKSGPLQRRIIIGVAPDAKDTEILDVLAHELAHDMVLMRLGEVPTTNLLGRFFGDARGRLPGGRRKWYQEFRKVQEIYWSAELGSRKKAMEFLRKTNRRNDEFELLADFLSVLNRRRSIAKKFAPSVQQQAFDRIIDSSDALKPLLWKQNVITEATLREMAESTAENAQKLAGEIKARITGTYRGVRDRIVAEQREFAEGALKQFEKEGFFDGMRVFYDGQMFEAVRVSPKTGLLSLRAITPGPGQPRVPRTVRIQDVQVPALQGVINYEKTLKNVVRNIVKQGVPRTLGIFARDENGNLVRAIFRTRDLERIRGTRADLRAWIAEHRGERALEGLTDPQINQLAGEIAHSLNKRGVLLQEEGGLVHIIASDVPNRAAIHYHGVSPEVIQHEVPRLIEGSFTLTPEDIVAEALYQSGVPVREVEHLAKLAVGDQAERLWKLAGEEFAPRITKDVWDDVLEGVQFFDEGGARTMIRSGGAVDVLEDGTHVIKILNHQVPGGITAKYANNPQVAKRFVADYAPPGAPDLTAGIPFPEELGAWVNPTGGTKPFKFGETIEARMGVDDLEKMVDVDQTKFEALKDVPEKVTALPDVLQRIFPWMVSSRTYAQHLERRGLGPVFSEIYQRSQEAIVSVKRAMIDPVDALGGRSFIKATNDLRKKIRKLDPERRSLISRYIMATDRQGFMESARVMGRPFNNDEKRIIQIIEALEKQKGVVLHDKVPRLISSYHTARSALSNPERFLLELNSELKGIPTSRMIRNQAETLVPKFSGDPSKMTMRDVVEAMGHPDEEINLIAAIGDLLEKKGTELNLFGISRYFSARETKAQVIAATKMTTEERKIADEVMDVISVAFGSKEEATRFMEGILPEVKNFVEWGFRIDDDMIKRYFGGHAEFLHRRVIAGDIDVYARDPVYLTWRVIRGKLMEKHWDPVEEAIDPAMRLLARRLGNGDVATGQRAVEYLKVKQYLDELRGIPHKSFESLQKALYAGLERVGLHRHIDADTLRDLMQRMNMVIYKSTIPLRFQLLVRNFAEVYRVGGVTGGEALGQAIKYVLSPKTREAAFKEAKRAGALKPDLPVFTVDPTARGLFGVGQRSVGRVGSARQKAAQKAQAVVQGVDDIVEKGFGYYQRVDEYTRAIGYHAMKFRLQKAIRTSGGNFNKVLENGKILTFDDTERLAFERLWRQGRQKDAVEYASTAFADRALFLYGNANHPIGWGSTWGVMFGQFGTWPIQYADWMLRGLSKGTMKDKVQFAAWNLAAPLGLVAAGKQANLDFNAWWGVPSLAYSGGPYLDASIDLIRSFSGTEVERAMARANLKKLNPLNQPIPNVLILGSFAVDDYIDIFTGRKSALNLIVKTIPTE